MPRRTSKWSLRSSCAALAVLLVFVATPTISASDDQLAPVQIAQATEPESEPQPEAVSQAEEKPGPQIEEIVITSRKREESLLDVPISVTAVTESEIVGRSIDTLEQLDQIAPNFELREMGNQRGVANILMRGITVQRSDIIVDPRVATYVDGVYHARLHGGIFDLFDVERVELLRGPQGTLFGKNTIGGLVHVIHAKPTEDFSGRARVGFGNKGRFTTAASLNLPIIPEKLLTRASFSTREADGWVTNQAQGGTDWYNTRRQAARFSVRAIPSESLELSLTGAYTRLRERNTLPKCEWVWAPMPPFSDSCTQSSLYSASKSHEDGPKASNTTTWATTGTITWDLGWADLTSISAWRRMENLGNIVDGMAVPYLLNHQKVEQEQFSEEVRLNGLWLDDRLNWVAGVYGFREKGDEHANFELIFFGCPMDGSLCRQREMYTTNQSWGVFTEGTYELIPGLRLTAGLRRTYERKELEQYLATLGAPTPGGNGKASKRFDAWTPRVNLSFDLTEHLMVYAGWSRGFTSGGFNSDTLFKLPYDQESASVWEAGFKGRAFDGRLAVSAAVFQTDYEDMQISVTRLVGGAVTNPIVNAAESTIQGAELEVVALPLPELQLRGSLGITDAEFDELTAEAMAAGLKKDYEFAFLPPIMFSLSGEYTLNLEGIGTLVNRLDWSHKAESELTAVNSPRIVQNKFGLLNGRMALTLPDGRTEIALWGRNLLNREYVDYALRLNPLGFLTRYTGEPRRYGVEVTYSWGD